MARGGSGGRVRRSRSRSAPSSARFLLELRGLGLFLDGGQLRLGLRDRPQLLFPGLDLSLGDQRHPVHHILGPLGTKVFQDVRAVEDAGEGVVVLLRDRVELVVVAAGTTEREAEERLAHGVDLVVHHVADDLLLVGVAAVPDAVREKRRGDQSGRIDLSSVGVRHQISGDLMDDELVEREVAVEGIDDPVAIAPGLGQLATGGAGLRVGVVVVGIAGHVEPVPRPALAIGRRGQEPIDDLLERRGRTIGNERRDLFRGWREAGQVERGATDPGPPVRRMGGCDPLRPRRVQEEGIDLIGHVVRTVRQAEAARSGRAGTPTSLDARRSARNASSSFRSSRMARVPPTPPSARAPRSRRRTASASAASSVRRGSAPHGSVGSRPGQPGRQPVRSLPLREAILGPSTGDRPSLSAHRGTTGISRRSRGGSISRRKRSPPCRRPSVGMRGTPVGEPRQR